MTVDFGLGWNASDLQIRQTGVPVQDVPVAPVVLGSLAKNLTLVQRRNRALDELLDGVKNKDPEQVQLVLHIHPSIEFHKYTDESFLWTALDNFNPAVLAALQNKGFSWSPYSYWEQLYNHSHNSDILNFLFDHSEYGDYVSTNNNSYPSIWENIISTYVMNAADSNFKGKNFPLDRLIEQRYPEIWKELSETIGHQNNVFHAGVVGNIDLAPYIERLDWDKVFTSLPHRLDRCDAAFVCGLQRFLETHPDVLVRWNQQQNDHNLHSRQVEALAQKWIGTTYKASAAHTCLSHWTQNKASTGAGYDYGHDYDLNNIHSYFKATTNTGAPAWMHVCGTDGNRYRSAYTKITLSAEEQRDPDVMAIVDFLKLKWVAPSFFEHMVAKGLPLVEDIVKTPAGAQRVAQALENPMVRFGFAQDCSLDVLRAVGKALPHSVAHVDEEGNTLLHLFAMNAKVGLFTQAQLGQFVRINPHSFFEPNADNKSVRDLLRRRRHAATHLDELSAVLMKKVVKSAPEVSRKIHGKTTTKRRM